MVAINAVVSDAAYPAPAKSTRAKISGRNTEITYISFSDRILFTVSATGSLAHWIQVPLAASADPLNAGHLESHDAENALLPLTNLTATTILGGTKQDDEILGQTLATTIGSSILLQNPNENRTLVLGLGLASTGSIDKASFDELVGVMLDLL